MLTFVTGLSLQAEKFVELPHWDTDEGVNFARSRILLAWHTWEQTGTKLPNNTYTYRSS